MHALLSHRMMVTALILSLLFFSDVALSLSPDGLALLQFRSYITHDPHRALSSWNADDNVPCNWVGIQCENGRVSTINLSGLSLIGTLPPELGQLINLRELILRENQFTGVIPSDIGGLESLEVFDVAHNQLSGQLPEELGKLSRLNRLYLENNNFEGVIPIELGELENLCELIISVNKLTGVIPGVPMAHLQNTGVYHGNFFETGMCKLKYLQVADFSSNYFEGDIPACLHHLPSYSFSFNCLLERGLPQQRPREDCTKASLLTVRRRLLQTDGSVGSPPVNETQSNDTITVAFNVSEVSPAPAPSAIPKVDSVVPNTQASSPIASPASSPQVGSVPASASLKTSSDDSKTLVAVVVASSIAACFVVAGVVMLMCIRRKGTAVRPWKSSMSGELQKGFTKGVPAFSRTELEAACEDFSNIIGFSPDIVLFKGTLSKNVEIAVTSIRKSAKSWSSNSELIFWKKVESLSQMKHPNLVNLLGYCAEEEPFVRMLVFEYVPNGTLHEQLHNKDAEHLDWETRMRIVLGIAHALDYMHHGLSSPIIHTKLDTKSVFLSEDFSAKVADFGVWKVSQAQKDSKLSGERTNVLGREDLELSDRLLPHLDTNVYDFGVLLLEIVSGRPSYSKEFGSLTEWALSYISSPEGMVCIVDPTLQQSYKAEELEVLCRMAYDCLQGTSSKILTMRQISTSLSLSLTSAKEPIIPRSSPLLWAELEILSQD